jgi:hypothetical protein
LRTIARESGLASESSRSAYARMVEAMRADLRLDTLQLVETDMSSESDNTPLETEWKGSAQPLRRFRV